MTAHTDPAQLVNDIVRIARKAGDEILKIYESADFNVEMKADDSPLTAADQAAHQLILAELTALTPDIPVWSEESAKIEFAERQGWSQFWLVDPLDGTKEFIKRNGEFTVNIALIQGHAAVLGVVHVPVIAKDYYGTANGGAFVIENGGEPQPIQVTKTAENPVRVVGSRSHRGASLESYLDWIGPHVMVPMGSSLKLCLVAAGEADVYPRLGLTSEWDTAAAQAVVEAAGGQVVDLKGNRLAYNTKEEVLNPFFIVLGDNSRDWTEGAQ
ncbi:MAG: 3'(2'),5'-bisphosphate nucleotidase CysQ [Gammaproteobacteria bacterium]|nr:3'(2'),5'-bisphosphate nucleotidase CysQ [Gammaproteobacteria bacterium]